MQRDTLDRFIAFVQKTHSGCVLWHEIIEIIIADELLAVRSRGLDVAALELLRHEINKLNPNNPRRLAWDILDIHAGAMEKVEAARAKTETETETESESDPSPRPSPRKRLSEWLTHIYTMETPTRLHKLTVLAQLVDEMRAHTLEAQNRVIKAAGEDDLRLMLLNRYPLRLNAIPDTMAGVIREMEALLPDVKRIIEN